MSGIPPLNENVNPPRPLTPLEHQFNMDRGLLGIAHAIQALNQRMSQMESKLQSIEQIVRGLR